MATFASGAVVAADGRRPPLDALVDSAVPAERVDVQLPQVLVVLVVHDGGTWLAESLDALEAQTYPNLRVVAVDNASTDGSRDLLLERVDPDRVVIAERDLGFGAAVSMGADVERSGDHGWFLLLHDDVALHPEAIERMVAHAVDDPRLGVVGPKLVNWQDPRRLQAVGMSVDITGRADSGLEADELDQGQRDRATRALYVPTAAMLVRRDVFERLGRFDRRYHVFRDDLDLCWRVWLAGYDVEVVPGAVARHAAAAANYRRFGRSAIQGPRYFAERNTLATLLKSYGGRRLALVLPLFLVVGVAKVLGFVATRRFSDALQTARAWVWNVVHLPQTLRLRRVTQAQRERSDAELRPLFVRVGPRLRAYGEAVAEWLAGGELDVDTSPDEVAEPPSATRRLVRALRKHPVSISAGALLVLGIVISIPLLRAGPLHGGDLAAWPDTSGAFFGEYLSSWHGFPGLGTGAPPSPAQALLGLLTIVSFGSGWLAQRIVLFGAFPLAWLLSLRAARLVTPALLPRLGAATAYVLSPPAVAALAGGRIRALAVLVALPALIMFAGDILSAGGDRARAWRATAGAALVAGFMVAFEPTSAWVVAAAVAVGLVAVALRGPGRGAAALRLVVVAGGAFALLAPWSIRLVMPGSSVFGHPGPADAVAAPVWRYLLLSPPQGGFPPLVAAIGLVTAAALGLAFGLGRRPTAAGTLCLVALGGVAAAFVLGRSGDQAWVWPGAVLLVVAAAYAGLLAIAFSSAAAQLGQHAFGWRQLLTVVSAAGVVVAVAAGLFHLLRDPWGGLLVDEPVLPAFVQAETEEVGLFRVVLVGDQDGAVRWDIMSAGGPTMLEFGVRAPDELTSLVSTAIAEMSSGSNPAAASRLGLANVRYVVVPEGGRTSALERVLGRQIGLEPQPVASGLVYRVSGWLPRVAHVPTAAAALIDRRGELPPGVDVTPLEPGSEPGTFSGPVPGAGELLVAEAAEPGWNASAGRLELRSGRGFDLVRFTVPGAQDDVRVDFGREGRRRTLVGVQLLIVFLFVSLLLRPPRFAQSEPV